MEKLKFLALADNDGQIETIEIGGLLVLETSSELKNELVNIADRLSNKVEITIYDLEEMDLSCAQVLMSFIRLMDQSGIKYSLEWDLDEDQKSFFVNVGIGVELFMNN